MAVVLVIADHESATRCCEGVAAAGHEPVPARNARQAMRELFVRRPVAVVLDADLPAPPGGLGLLERLRQVAEVPVLLVGELGAEDDRVRVLRLGADGYLLKPFGRRELGAWVESLVRRQAGAGATPLELGTQDVRVDLRSRRVTAFGRDVHLSPLEFRVLTALAGEPGTSVGAERLARAAWHDQAEAESGLLQVVISRLRQKLGPDPHTGESPVETVRGFGYRLRDEGPAVRRSAPRARRADRRTTPPEPRAALR